MPTPAENVRTAYENVCAKLAEASASPQPNYSVDGKSVSHADYFTMLSKQVGELKKLVTVTKGPYYRRSRHRG